MLKRIPIFVTGIALALSTCLLAQPTQPKDKYVPGHVLVKFRPSAGRLAMSSAHMAVSADVEHTFSSVEGLQLVRLSSSAKLGEVLAAYRANPDVQYAEPDYIVHAFRTPNDPLFPTMWSLLNTGQSSGTPGADIKATQAWNVTTGSSSVVIAVLDTGVDYNHPDLAANIFTGPICPGDVVCHGINLGPNVLHDENDPFDDNGHGTHVSGTIGALGNNGVGVTGINWAVTILPCKFLGSSGDGAVSDAIKCLDFIKTLKDTKGMNIVASNNSWGGTDFSQALQDAIDRQRQSGILFIAAAGNDFADNDIRPFYPASYSLPNIVSVAATDRNDKRVFFSNVGRHTVHLGAPGQDILSTLPDASYGLDSGTSMAAPHVTGVAALLAAQDPARDWRAIKNLLLAGGDLVPDLAKTVSGRRLNALNSLLCTNSVVSGRVFPTTDVVSGAAGMPLTLSVLNINCAQPNGAVQATVSPGGQTIQLVDDGTAQDISAGDGVYTGSFTPGATGVYTLTFSTGGTLTVQVLTNYQPASAAFHYRTITGTGVDLGDDDVAQVTSPFPIAFGNGSFTKFWISANGTISFSGAFSSYLHEVIPTTLIPTTTAPISASTLVAPFWDDLLPLKGTAQNVFWDVTGTAPNRELVVEWRDVRVFECAAEPDTVKFQVVFFENSSDVLFNYSDAAFGGSCANHDRGGNGSIGVQVAPQLGTSWSFEGQSVTDGSALLWQVSSTVPSTPPTPVITSISPATVPAFSPDFTVTVNGSNFLPGVRASVSGGFDRATTFISSTQLSILIAASDTDLFQIFFNQLSIALRNPGFSGQFSPLSETTLTINNPANPTISSLEPALASADGLSFFLGINGSNFTPFTKVTWNGEEIGAGASANHLSLVVPGRLVTAPGTAQIQVINPGPGGGSSAPFSYTIGPPGTTVLGTPDKLMLVQHPRLSGERPGTANLNTATIPSRFLGWNYAQKMGPQYTQHFARPYGNLFIASDKANASPQAGSTSLLASASALPGLELNDARLTGFLPSSVAVGDFNGDGHADYVVSNGGSNDLWIYFGNGDGTFQLPRIIPLAGQSPIQVLAADLRGSGALDLIVAEPDSLSVGVLLGNGDGTFGAETLYFAPGPPFSIGVGDFRGTGHLDVVAGIIGDNRTGPLVLFPGDGTGKLSPPIFSPTTAQFLDPWVTFQIAVADFDKDGLPDLVVTDFGPFSPGITVYKTSGDGIFKQKTQVLFSDDRLEFFTAAATGDLNHDSCPDIVAVDDLGLATVILGNCDGTFRPGSRPVQFGDGDAMANVTLADVDGDGNLDVVSSGAPLVSTGGFGAQSGSLVSVARGDGAGGLFVPQLYRVRPALFALAVGDFNEDLHPDIVVASQDTDSTSVLLSSGTGRFSGPHGGYVGWAEKGSLFPGVLNAPIEQFVGDLNGDGKPDLFHVDFGQTGTLPWNISVSLNDGTSHFAQDIKSPILEGTFIFGSLIAGDFRNSGKNDLIVIPSQFGETLSGHFYNFVPSNGDGHFGRPITHNISHLPGTLAAGDFNGDGKLDFVMVGGSSVDTFLGNGDGTFNVGPSLSFVNGFPPATAYVADVNGDGKLDLLVPIALGPSTIVEFLGHGDGSFEPAKAVIVDVGSGTGFADAFFGIADFNHDGHLDVVVRNPQFFAPLMPVFKIFMGQPDGTFILGNTYTPYSGTNRTNSSTRQFPFSNSFVGDFNGDGNPDIAAFQEGPSGAYVQFMLGNGDGTFTPTFEKFPLGKGNFTYPSVVPDLNGDGKADLAELDGFTASYNIILSTAGHPFQIQFVSLPVIGSHGVVRVSLPFPAVQDTTLQLASSDPAITVQSSVSIPAGSVSADVNVTVGPTFDKSQTFSITATDGLSTSKTVASVAVPGTSLGLISFFNSAPFRALLPGQVPDDFGYRIVSRGGYQTTVSLHCENLPPGVTCQFGNTSLEIGAGGFTGTSLFLNIASPLPVGTYTFDVVAADAAISQTLQGRFQVGDFGIQFDSAGSSALPSGSQLFKVDLTPINNYQGAVILNCSGLPAGATCVSSSTVFGISPSVVLGLLVQTSNLAVGNYPFVIDGQTGFTTHSVNAVLHVGDFGTATISPGTATLSVGQSATFNLTVASLNGFNDTVDLLCIPTVNSHGTNAVDCNVSPSRATFDLAGNLHAQMKVTINAAPQSGKLLAQSSQARWGVLLSAFIMVGLISAAMPRRRRKMVAVCGICLLGIASVISCGGGGGGGVGSVRPTPTPTPTPQPAVVKIDVLGSSTSQNVLIQRSVASFNVTVQ